MHSTLNRDQADALPASPTNFSRDWQMRLCTRLLSETKQVRFLHPAPSFYGGDSSNRIRIMPSKHGTPVRIRHPLPDVALSFNGSRIPGYEPGDWGSNPHGAARFEVLELTA